MKGFRRPPELKLGPTLGPALGFLIVAVLFLSTHGFSQAQTANSPRRLTQDSVLPAIDRGVMPGGPPPTSRWQGRAVTSDARPLDRAAAAGARYLPGRVIVKFRGTPAAAVRLRAVQQVSPSAVLAARLPSLTVDDVTLDPNEDAEAVARAFRARADVEFAQVVYRAHLRFVPNDPLYGQLQWNFSAIDLPRGWDIQQGASTKIIVAVIDTGMAFRDENVQFFGFPFSLNGVPYPALGLVTVPFARATDLAVAGTTGDARFVAPHDFIWGDNNPLDTDEFGHGTHVSGTIGELTNNNLGVAGIAFNARLMPVKVISSVWDDIFGSPFEGTDETVAQGIRYAADNGAKILNMSIGRAGDAGSAPVVEDAIRYAVGKGCFVAIAGGNSFPDNETEVYAEIASRVDGAVAVAATDRNHQRASYSTVSPYIELAAPGGSDSNPVYQQTYDSALTSTFELPPSQYHAPRFDALAIVPLEGTSMATPHVSGLAALLMQQGITKPAAIEAALERFATDLGTTGRDPQFGFGEINARATLRGLGLAK